MQDESYEDYALDQGDTFDLSKVVWVTTDEKVQRLKWLLDETGTIIYDLETTGLDEHAVRGGSTNGGVAARVVLASFTFQIEHRHHTWVLPLSHPDSPFQGRWQEVLREVAEHMQWADLVGHNVKFDSRWIYATTGVDLSKAIHWDTQISSHLLNENESTKLKERAPRTFGVERWDDVDLKHPGAAEEEPLMKLGEYAARDTYWTAMLYWRHYSQMTADPQDPGPFDDEELELLRLGRLAEYVAMPTTATLTAMEQRGLHLDTDWVQSEMDNLREMEQEKHEELSHRYEQTAPDLDPEDASFAPTSTWFKRWAEAAVDAGDLRVAALTPSGKPQWSKSVLKRQARSGSDVAEDLLALRASVKRLEFLESWMAKATPEGKIHATYNAGSVVTGRLSSSGPNMQQVTKALKPAFAPSPGHYLAELDYSQIELRVAAFVSQCQPMIAAFKRGDDLHRLIASRINNKPPEEITPKERQQGKAANFGLLYGMGAYGFQQYAEDAYGVTMSEEEAARVHDAYFEMWDGLRDWHLRAMMTASREGQISSPIGRVRHLQDKIWAQDEKTASFGERAAINSPVQGFASDIMQIAASLIEGTNPMSPVPGKGIEGARLVGTVHDSILVEVPIDTWEQTVRECQRQMETGVLAVLENLDVYFSVPLVADATVGTRWGLSDVGEL